MDVTINEIAIRVPVEILTWGDLLDWVETDYLKADQCITHVYLNGTEALHYRNRLICNQQIGTVTPVAIKSGDFDSIISDSMAELGHELTSSFELIDQIIRLLRDQREQEAYSRLAQVLNSLRIFVHIFSEDLGWTEPRYAFISRSEISSTLARALRRLIAAQEDRYSVYICDVLEYDVAPILESLQGLVERTCEHIS